MNGLIITNELVEKFGLFLRLEEKVLERSKNIPVM